MTYWKAEPQLAYQLLGKTNTITTNVYPSFSFHFALIADNGII